MEINLEFEVQINDLKVEFRFENPSKDLEVGLGFVVPLNYQVFNIKNISHV